jgi:5-(carboxyamino)imidazole ribonucleotide synthase
MLYQAAMDLNVKVRILTGDANSAAAQVCPDYVVDDWNNETALRRFATGCEVVTFDHELVDTRVLRSVEAGRCTLRPAASSMQKVLDKASQRRLVRELHMPTPDYLLASDRDALQAAVLRFGYPAVMKATRGGYDGRGVHVLSGDEDLNAWSDLPSEWLVEPLLPIERELAVQVVRGVDGELRTYPVVETYQSGGICRSVVAPAIVPPELADTVRRFAEAIAESCGIVGVLAVEFFVVGGELMVNELAPRVHNTAHYTVEACAVSQFENHVRAVLGWPLGPTDLVVPAAVMTNVIAGPDPLRPLSEIRPFPPVRVHLYGKQTRAGRKVGHVTACGDDAARLRQTADRVAAMLVGESEAVPSGAPSDRSQGVRA